jgi:hypothetical protein
MIVIVDEEKHAQPNRRFRQAPPVANDVRRPHHALSSDANRDLSSRMDDLGLTDDNPRYDYGNTSRVASPYGERNGERNGSGAHRHMLLDSMRSPPSPRRSINEQRAAHAHSGANSLRDNKYGHGNSVDSFHI